MKLTPLDIHHKEFSHSLRGYSEEQVDQFLDEVADEFERLFKENIDLSEKLDTANERLQEFELQRQTINNTLVAAQRSAEDIQAKAQGDADLMLKDAEVKAKEIIHNALSRKQQVQGELVRIKQAEEEFRGKLKAMLDQYQRQVTEIALPDDVEVMLGETDAGVVADVAVRPPVEPRPEPGAADAAFAQIDLGESVAPAAAAAVVDEEAPAVEEAPGADAPIEPEAIDATEATSAYVQSVTLGELDQPEVDAGVPQLDDPIEFKLPSIDRLGEREDDVEIEEID